jgi:hypothetical protein
VFPVAWQFGHATGTPSQTLTIINPDGTTGQFGTDGFGQVIKTADGQWEVMVSGGTRVVITTTFALGSVTGSPQTLLSISGPVHSIAGFGSVFVQGDLQNASVSDASSLTVSGNLQNASVSGVSSLTVHGNLDHTTVLGGSNFNLVVDGSMTASTVRVSQDPVDGIYDNGNDVFGAGSVIQSVSIGGTLDSTSRFYALSYPATVSINGQTVAPPSPQFVTVNQPPIAQPDNKSAQENVALTFPATDLLANDSDPDGDALTVTAVTATAQTLGIVSLNNGTVSYTPPANFIGTDAFQYTISDGHGGTTTALVTVNIMAPQTGVAPVVSAPSPFVAGQFQPGTQPFNYSVPVSAFDPDGGALYQMQVTTTAGTLIPVQSPDPNRYLLQFFITGPGTYSATVTFTDKTGLSTSATITFTFTS